MSMRAPQKEPPRKVEKYMHDGIPAHGLRIEFSKTGALRIGHALKHSRAYSFRVATMGQILKHIITKRRRRVVAVTGQTIGNRKQAGFHFKTGGKLGRMVQVDGLGEH